MLALARVEWVRLAVEEGRVWIWQSELWFIRVGRRFTCPRMNPRATRRQVAPCPPSRAPLAQVVHEGE